MKDIDLEQHSQMLLKNELHDGAYRTVPPVEITEGADFVSDLM